ncbi:hypothetical protein MNBD_ACTINO01-830 [hydrothermal vent metagenome]|uniref:Uncharacterized protein n=1 Tax=hydrothermal vent metagenome TaxID=652676 RepID=A0A3B0SZL1_9ZZZZ
MMDERGSMLPMFAGLLFVSFTILALAVEIALLGAVWRQAADIADIAAEAGAAVIDERLLHTADVVAVDTRAAGHAALVAAHDLGVARGDVTVAVDAATVCVTIRIRHVTRSLRFIAVEAIPVEVSRCAVPAVG